MYFFSAFGLFIIVYVPRVLCGDQCFGTDSVQVVIDGVGAEYLPCDPSASASNCCPKGWICLSNGLCKAYGTSSPNKGETSLYTGLCTDPLWKNQTSCPKICNNNPKLRASIGNGIVSCGYGTFCCYGQGSECCDMSFSLGIAADLTTLTGPSPTAATLMSSTPTNSTPTNSNPVTSTPVNATPANTIPDVILSTINVIPSRSTLHSAVTEESSSVAPSAPKARLDQDAIIGIGVGVAVGLAFLASFLYFMRSLYFIPRRAKNQPEGSMYVDGKSEMDAVTSQRKETRVLGIVNDRRAVQLNQGNVPVELGEPSSP